MIALKPNPYNDFPCPGCGAEKPEVKAIVSQGIHFLADCHCAQCGLDFYEVLPVGHAIDYHLAFNKSNGEFYNAPEEINWLTEPLTESFKSIQKDKVAVEKKVFKASKNVVVLNTLDYLYGHVLLKLYNAQHHLEDENTGLVIILPKSMEWLIPEGCAEAWLVDLKLSEQKNWYLDLQQFIQKEFERFDTIQLSNAYSHPDFTQIDIEKFTKIKPFDVAKFSEQPPCITFIVRQDRWWFQSIFSYVFYRIGRKLKILNSVGKYLTNNQDKLIRKTIRKIKKEIPEVEIFLTGFGKSGNMNGLAKDLRVEKMNAETEINWCKTYAKSQLVIGFHGSNMLLPTAFAAGCIEILPKDRYGNMVQDISVRYADRRQLFLYQFCEQYASPESVAQKAISMLKNFDAYNKNMKVNLYQ